MKDEKKLMQCKTCGNEIAKSAKKCPHCGAKNKKPIFKKWWFWALIIVIVISVASGSGETEGETTALAEESALTEEVAIEETKENNILTEEEPVEEEPVEEEPVEEEPVVEEPALSLGKINALGSAENYLRIMAFSYKGLIEQLEFEGYSNEEAVYAADHCGADWNEQAAKAAKNYLDLMSFSRQGLIDQLVFEGYTQEQAEYGVTANGY